MSRILVVDDELSMREFLEIFFLQNGHEVVLAEDGTEAVQLLHEHEFDLVITDLRMPGTHGMVVLRRCRELYPETPVIVMTAYASTNTAIEAIRIGACDYFSKSFKLDEIELVIDKALEKRRLVVENRELKARLEKSDAKGGLIGRSRQMKEVFSLIRRVATTRTNVLILGARERKGTVARAVHEESARAQNRFWLSIARYQRIYWSRNCSAMRKVRSRGR